MLALQTVNSSLIPSIVYGPPNTVRNDPRAQRQEYALSIALCNTPKDPNKQNIFNHHNLKGWEAQNLGEDRVDPF